MATAGEYSDKEKFVTRLDLTASNVASLWKVFKSEFGIYQIAKSFSKMSEEVKIANMLLLMGRDSVPIYNQFVFNESADATKKTLVNVIAMFDMHFEPVKNVIYERVKFNNLKQEANQSIHQFIVTVQTQAVSCDYGEPIVHELVRDRIVVGVRDSNLRDYLVDIDGLDLPKCIQKAKQYVSFHAQTRQMGSCSNKSENDNIDTVSTRNESGNYKGQSDNKKLDRKCQGCGGLFHRNGKCPAKGVTCFKCGKLNHFSKACRSKQKVNEVYESSMAGCAEEVDDLFLGDSL